MISPNSSTTTTTTANANIMAPATARFPFASPQSEPFSATHDGPSSPSTLGKKKRGRPRKYSPDGNIALGLAPVSSPVAATSAASAGDSGNADAPPKKHRGRPPGSGKKQLDALGAGGTGFTPHVILVESGEDITEKVMAFSQTGPRTVCILSAIGAISRVILRQPASGSIARYEGQFEIVSLSGPMPLSENNGEQSRTSSLYVSVAGADGRVLGGAVAGELTAASTVQVIVGSFIVDRKKSSSSMVKSGPSSAPTSQMLNFGAPTTPTSPTSQGPSTESSEENDHNSNFSRGPGLYNNANQPVHNNMQQMYHHPLWAGQTHP